MNNNLNKIVYTLKSIKENDSHVSTVEVEYFYDFHHNYGHNSIQNTFVNFKAKRKLIILCKSLDKLEEFINNNHIDNSGGLSVKIRVLGSNSGVYDRSKHKYENKNINFYKNLYNKTFKYYKKFYRIL